MGDLFKDTIKNLTPDLTEEEWEERDRRIREQLERERVRDELAAFKDRRARIIGSGFSAGVLDEIAENIVGGEEDTPAMKAVREMGPGEVLVMSGGTGCGKTYAAHRWCLGLDLSPSEWRSTHSKVIRSAEFSRASKFTDGEGRSKFDDLHRVKRLVLDDLGVEHIGKSKAIVPDLYEVFNTRILEGLPMVVTTNITGKEFKERYGERIASRLRGHGRFCYVPYDDMRARR